MSQQHQITIHRSHTRETPMKIKLITVLTTVVLFALPIAEASANRYI